MYLLTYHFAPEYRGFIFAFGGVFLSHPRVFHCSVLIKPERKKLSRSTEVGGDVSGRPMKSLQLLRRGLVAAVPDLTTCAQLLTFSGNVAIVPCE